MGVKMNTIEIITNIMLLSPYVEYEEYLAIICPEDFAIKKEIRERGLALSFGTSHLNSFFEMKSSFKNWFLYTLNEAQRERFITFITNHHDILVERLEEVINISYKNSDNDISFSC